MTDFQMGFCGFGAFWLSVVVFMDFFQGKSLTGKRLTGLMQSS